MFPAHICNVLVCFHHSYRRYGLLTRFCRRVKKLKIQNGGATGQTSSDRDGKHNFILEVNKGQKIAMGKAILGDYIWRLMLRIKRNRQYIQPNKALPRVLAGRTALTSVKSEIYLTSQSTCPKSAHFKRYFSTIFE